MDMVTFLHMKKGIAVIGVIVSLALFTSFDLGFFWSLLADGRMDMNSSGGRFQYSLIRHARCAILFPEKTFRSIGDDAWMTEVTDGYWCMSDEDIEKFKATRG